MMKFTPVNVYSLISVKSLYSIYDLNFSKGYSYPGESHNFWEFSYIISGSAGCTSGDSIYMCKQGDGILNSPNLFHSMWVPDDSSCEMFIISFDGSGLEHQLTPGLFPLNSGEKQSVEAILNEVPKLFGGYNSTEYTQLLSLSAPDNVGYQIIKSHLELICLSLIRRGKEAMGLPLSDARSQCYYSITAFLRENIDRQLTIEEISAGVYESPAKIKEVFRLFTGGGVMQFFNHLRCERIMVLLSELYSVKDIAAKMGFSSPYYLSYFFKRETGMTARDYLKKHSASEKQ